MSAVSRPGPATLRPLRESDLNTVMAIEVRGYPFPWTRGIFVDCLRAGYPGLAMERERAAQRVFLEVRPSNAPALALYHSEGFNEIGRRPRY
ncbi:MAG: hypothetical protein GAK31_03089 [Stenotrophomonas maltophilia]|uniref:Ribosomal-protein-alanine N-acetyltransferase n=1 Tax=Stenotrophomonas maltophilia TaxID=40324 RepID=A0A7V8FEY3_STEMA|nr:MAG: hypothetical protein GAK31_03089 [Stenotrophomonas maltophilia]